jgi:hypothetical protein
MHPTWQIPELLVQIVSLLSADDISRCFLISYHFRAILKANLPPELRPLPDSLSPRRLYGSQTFPQGVQDTAKAYLAQEDAKPKQLKFEDNYYFWHEGARREVLNTLSPHLHPVLAKHATHLIDGYDALAAGNMGICLQTEIPYHDLYDLVNGKERQDSQDLLAVVPPKSVIVFCLGGVSWDLLYTNVRYRLYGDLERFSVRVERESGVRMVDVLDELRGTLVVNGMSGGLGQHVFLTWVFDDCLHG